MKVRRTRAGADKQKVRRRDDDSREVRQKDERTGVYQLLRPIHNSNIGDHQLAYNRIPTGVVRIRDHVHIHFKFIFCQQKNVKKRRHH